VTPRIPWRSVRLYGLTALAGFVAAYLIVAFFILPGDRNRGTVTAPNVVGMPLEDARRVLDSAGLQFSLGDERASADVPRNSVLAQSPPAGAGVSQRGSVTLDISAGPRQVRIPSVAGLTVEEAQKVLSDSGLSAGSVQDETSTSPRGEVLRSKPDAGRFVGEGAAVDLIVSAGPPELAMPDVIGRDPSDALAVLNQLGLTRVRVDSQPGGSGLMSVLAQQPTAGTGLRLTDRVILRVGSRP
jgi:serine/threonine-protein kinase